MQSPGFPKIVYSGGSIKRKNKLSEDSSARRSESSITGYVWVCRFTSPEKECWSCGLLTAIQNHEVRGEGGGNQENGG